MHHITPQGHTGHVQSVTGSQDEQQERFVDIHHNLLFFPSTFPPNFYLPPCLLLSTKKKLPFLYVCFRTVVALAIQKLLFKLQPLVPIHVKS